MKNQKNIRVEHRNACQGNDSFLFSGDFKLDNCLANLKSSERALFIMADRMGYSIAEISSMLCRSEMSIKDELQRIRLSIRKSLVGDS